MDVFECRMCRGPVVVGELPARLVRGEREATFILLDATPTATTSGFRLVDALSQRFVPAGTSSAYAPHWTTCPAVGRAEGPAWNRKHFGFLVPTAP